ncbi:MAG: hypothetical protein KGZ70_02080 [Hydrogenophaga sp.]|uniref:hypothetical protein n=1 Tax=Hydrogenophaga sp. TaxID=1904254 RepID=UPI001BC735FD|nr:hypothetical protein [Hydrogenophaga sp.]MBS3910618.1 hypothetical protein [Hydrogenophaga sp.]MDO9147843.1 hypothetical protein [Hydrogenophaga sp.]MDO9603331.1 hypothetical protein [Hydrogenophaga sp.]MDP2164998.1 hypothetical protein [Hydrogenophaga sp.]MDP3477980.1 hypothetical protein [Hydrogenophaga sp.]
MDRLLTDRWYLAESLVFCVPVEDWQNPMIKNMAQNETIGFPAENFNWRRRGTLIGIGRLSVKLRHKAIQPRE